MTTYYNEIDPHAAAWLRNLIDAGHIAPGVVDTRSIEDVRPDDLRGFDQCHFFAGVGVWSLALRRAGWSDHRSVWTGSCPCQPFSAAGKGAGFADERHLWPAWHHLICECKPPVVFGEQVASSDAMPWLDLVQDDMEGVGYAFGALPFPAASVGAPHIRDRLYWVADGCGARLEVGERDRRIQRRALGAREGQTIVRSGDSRELADTDRTGCPSRGGRRAALGYRSSTGADCGVVRSFWADAEWIACRDGKARPVEPGVEPLAHGAPARVVRLRAYGNAIVAPQAQIFIEAVMASAEVHA